MQKLLKFLVKFLSKYIKHDVPIVLTDTDEPASALLSAVCAYALSINHLDKVHWDTEKNSFCSSDKKEFNVWFNGVEGKWEFKKINTDDTYTTALFNNTPANTKIVRDTVEQLGERSHNALLAEFKAKLV